MANYNIGLPAWAYSGWNNTYFNTSPTALASYASVFNTVEGNTTFYHVPDEKSVSNWLESVAGHEFKFCFKFPKSVTHLNKPNLHELELFIRRISPLTDHIGPFLLQFPSTVGPNEISRIDSILENIPEHFRTAIEVRNEDFFTHPELLEPTIEKYKLGRVIMDTRSVFNGDRNHPEVLAALHQKPDLPVPGQVYNGLMMIRLLLHPDLASNEKYIDQWATRTARALNSDCQCYMMIHCPNNQHCPELALQFHNSVRRKLQQSDSTIELPTLAPWPIPQQQNLL